MYLLSTNYITSDMSLSICPESYKWKTTYILNLQHNGTKLLLRLLGYIVKQALPSVYALQCLTGKTKRLIVVLSARDC